MALKIASECAAHLALMMFTSLKEGEKKGERRAAQSTRALSSAASTPAFAHCSVGVLCSIFSVFLHIMYCTIVCVLNSVYSQFYSYIVYVSTAVLLRPTQYVAFFVPRSACAGLPSN